MNIENRPCVIAFTTSGREIAAHLAQAIGAEVATQSDIAGYGGLKTYTGIQFKANRPLIFVCAVGIAVRSIAPFVADKFSDPPVLVVDDGGRFVISLLSGHLGGANAHALNVAQILKARGFDAVPVVTTATDGRGLQGLEAVFSAYGVPVEAHRTHVKEVNMAIAEGAVFALYLDPLLGDERPFGAAVQYMQTLDDLLAHQGPKAIITLRRGEVLFEGVPEAVYAPFMVPSRSLVVGTGCRKDLSPKRYLRELDAVLTACGLLRESVAVLASVDIKAEEACILEAASALGAETQFFSAEALIVAASRYEGSDFVEQQVGVRAVAGPSAYVLTQDDMADTVYKREKCTFSIGRQIR